MFDYFNWKSEIADVMFALTQLVDHVAGAEKIGGFELVERPPAGQDGRSANASASACSARRSPPFALI
jgi:hypothetical protein